MPGNCEISSVGRARPSQGRGRGFEPRISLFCPGTSVAGFLFFPQILTSEIKVFTQFVVKLNFLLLSLSHMTLMAKHIVFISDSSASPAACPVGASEFLKEKKSAFFKNRHLPTQRKREYQTNPLSKQANMVKEFGHGPSLSRTTSIQSYPLFQSIVCPINVGTAQHFDLQRIIEFFGDNLGTFLGTNWVLFNLARTI